MLRNLTAVAYIFPLVLTIAPAAAGEIDLKNAVIVRPPDLSGPENKAITVLVEEVEKRTLIRFEVSDIWPGDSIPVIAVGPTSKLRSFAGRYATNSSEGVAEGYRISIERAGRSAPAVLVAGNDARGVMFGVGRLLRELHMSKSKITLADDLRITTAPKYPLRGHQLGYRPKTNSYDGWTPEIWEQYIRDLAVWGTNAIELIPPRSDDAATSPHFPLPPIDMMARMSKIADDYGMDVWIWYPALDRDYANPATVEFALKEWGEVFKKLPRIDAVFVPGGDPGHTQPRYLFPLIEKQTANLKRYHPKAAMWMSPQSFTKQWMDEFYQIVKQEPAWLSGIVHGPQVRVLLPELRAAVPKRYPIRRYPDITHSLRCQYPVPNWDLAYALTEGREVINPRPLGTAHIFQIYQNQAVGFLTYSEGCNDDVNKIIWSSLGWDSEAKVIDILRQYSRYFIGEEYGEDFAQGLLALERNWHGPLLTNASVTNTLKQLQQMEKNARPRELLNWRFQQGLYRAYFDAYQRSRLVYETGLEEQATAKLRAAREIGSLRAIQQAEAILDRAVSDRVSPEWRARAFELAEALFQSIRMQLSVERYKAIAVGRGANLDTIDVPLNNRPWLTERFAEIRQLTSENEQLRAIEAIVNWTDPGPGGFYDDLGNPSRQPHLVRGLGWSKDPAFYQSAQNGFHYVPSWRRSWCDHAESLYDSPLQMRYGDLDPKTSYKIRVVYGGDVSQARLRLLADDQEVHSMTRKPAPVRPVEFDIPPRATADGQVTLTWQQEPGRGGSGRGCQVAEVWLVKK